MTHETYVKALEEEREELKAQIAELKAAKETLEGYVKDYVPYVLATLPMSAHVSRTNVTTSNPEWTAIHLGRALSSKSFLEKILKVAKGEK